MASSTTSGTSAFGGLAVVSFGLFLCLPLLLPVDFSNRDLYFPTKQSIAAALITTMSGCMPYPFSAKAQSPDNFSSDNRVDGVYCRQQPLASTLPPLLPCYCCYMLSKSLYLATAFAVPCHRCGHVAATLFFRWTVPR
ncbi:hypothetical protein B296_00000092 [Ensete ventricosum]|uniref:Uncharacterized protein n=1 Tax=Ensete ventricosum TaxID=4639 RepID=A0A427B2T6_ENSVE|nr:hypothetical protein B296_00000092 [Ensete ventricosum]